MQRDSQLPRQCDLGLARPGPVGNRPGPVAQAGATEVAAEDRVRRLEQAFAGEPVPSLGDPPVPADLAGLVAPRRQPEIGACAGRPAEPGSIVEGRDDGQRRDRPHAGSRHQQPDGRMPLGSQSDPAVECGNAGQDVAPGLHQCLEDRDEFRGNRKLPFDDVFGAAFEPADPLAEHDAKGLQQSPYLVLQPNPHADQRIACREHRSVDIGVMALDLHGLGTVQILGVQCFPSRALLAVNLGRGVAECAGRSALRVPMKSRVALANGDFVERLAYKTPVQTSQTIISPFVPIPLFQRAA